MPSPHRRGLYIFTRGSQRISEQQVKCDEETVIGMHCFE